MGTHKNKKMGKSVGRSR